MPIERPLSMPRRHLTKMTHALPPEDALCLSLTLGGESAEKEGEKREERREEKEKKKGLKLSLCKTKIPHLRNENLWLKCDK